jgi:hypothetical protein
VLNCVHAVLLGCPTVYRCRYMTKDFAAKHACVPPSPPQPKPKPGPSKGGGSGLSDVAIYGLAGGSGAVVVGGAALVVFARWRSRSRAYAAVSGSVYDVDL